MSQDQQNEQVDEKKMYTIEDVKELLEKHRAASQEAVPKIWKFQELIPNNKVLNQLQIVGKGGQALVYKLEIDNEAYAFKQFVQKRGISQQQLVNDFYQECYSLLCINDERVLRLEGVVWEIEDEDDFTLGTITKLQQKGNLFDLIHSQNLFPVIEEQEKRFSKKLELLYEIAEGLKAIHEANLIHRDLKSQNILIDEQNKPKIADLGLAKNSSLQSTQLGRGTVQWMAPEQFQYKFYKQSDI